MSRRASLPGAAELFRSTGGPAPSTPTNRGTTAPQPVPVEPPPAAPPAAPPEDEPSSHSLAPGVSQIAAVAPVDPAPARTSGVRSTGRRRSRVGERRPTGRERHEEKITVYVSPDELIDLEQARLTLRGEHGLAVDRGRIVREAVAVVLADLDAKGESSILVRRLRGL
jgi:hypothetical protein